MAKDFFLKITDIPGGATDSKHKDQIDVESWNWGEAQDGSAGRSGGGGAGKVDLRDFNFKMQANKSSPKLFLACATGKRLKEALLTCRRAGGKQETYLTVKMSDVIISSYRTGTADGDKVFDDVTINFVKIRVSYFPQKGDGSPGPEVAHEYDRSDNTSS